jgi:hypothetical protein
MHGQPPSNDLETITDQTSRAGHKVKDTTIKANTSAASVTKQKLLKGTPWHEKVAQKSLKQALDVLIISINTEYSHEM